VRSRRGGCRRRYLILDDKQNCFGCGPGTSVPPGTPQERMKDSELMAQIARGLQSAADAMMTLAQRQERIRR